MSSFAIARPLQEQVQHTDTMLSGRNPVLIAGPSCKLFRMMATSIDNNPSISEAVRLATILRKDLDALDEGLPISPTALTAPRRRSLTTSALASAGASQLFSDGSHEPLRALIQYEKAIVALRVAFHAQEQDEKAQISKKKRAKTWPGRIEAQGPWNEVNDPMSLEGPEAIPMPVKISSAESLTPFFGYLAQGGDFDGRGDRMVQLEPYYEEPYIEFEKGVLYRDQRMDLCKMYVADNLC